MNIEKLTVRYGEHTIFDGFDLDVAEGETLCVLGKSGTGKTTLLNAIAGLIPYGGAVTGQGKCAYVFQEPRLIPSLTVAQNIRYAAGGNVDTDAILAQVELADAKDFYPRKLSGGMAQRASVARAFAVGGKTVLLDEPFRALDLGLKERMIALFLKLKRESGVTAVYVTHDVDEALACGDRILVLDRGAVIADERNEPSGTLGTRNETLYKKLTECLIAL